MNAREEILNAIRVNKPAAIAVTVPVADQLTLYKDPVEQFKITLESIGGKLQLIKGLDAVKEILKSEQEKGLLVADMVCGTTPDPQHFFENKTADFLKDIHLTCLEAMIGVAENGSVWIPESAMGNRLIPFICQHLIIVLRKDKIVSNMHQAYEQINTFEEGFGVFLAGPSKTADIEQSLVIGAHGARSLRVFLIDNC